uniref:Uncharacterized protein n=1 Tax=Lepeophtheirus salmonis TaxID=72036 RepID=A0A0K2V9S8_LEPSM
MPVGHIKTKVDNFGFGFKNTKACAEKESNTYGIID